MFVFGDVLICQIFLPAGYLKATYEHVRTAGGVCIADEVQVGLGRVGTHWWAFQTQDVVPDIVTLGKPLGNGFPLGAVVTTRAIADRFNNGMEYFNTFGGSTMSCAVGLAVLEVMQQERLMDHAAEIGEYMLQGLKQVQSEFAIFGDVRGEFVLAVPFFLVMSSSALDDVANPSLFMNRRFMSYFVLRCRYGFVHWCGAGA